MEQPNASIVAVGIDMPMNNKLYEKNIYEIQRRYMGMLPINDCYIM